MKINCFWFRRDLRLEDNVGLYHALKSEYPVLPVFVFDKHILSKLKERDARVTFIHQTLEHLQEQLKALGSTMLIKYGTPEQVWQELVATYDIATVFTNRDYEPYAKERDEAIEEYLTGQGIDFKTYKDHVIFERAEVVKADGTPYTVFTPYSKTWKKKLHSEYAENGAESGALSVYLQSYPTEQYFDNFFQSSPIAMPRLAAMGFERSDITFPPNTVKQGIIRNYDQTRNFPAVNGTSRLGVHFRFGTISIREKARKAIQLNETFLNELIWRDFYSMILAHFPHVVSNAFRAKYDNIEWRIDEDDFQKWCAGKTGYPLVDAGMRELNATGYMHNRVRMLTASFLTKHLLLDWRWGEAYFAEKLLDFDLASNNGGWQWAAGSGTDAAPYFRIFNPTTQLKKFDKDLKYVKKWIPEYGTTKYPNPVVEHKFARERCLRTYKEGLARVN